MRIVFYLITILCLLLFPSVSAQAARNAMAVWAQSIVPVLFPYMLFCRLLNQSIHGIRLPKLLISALLGMLGGSPGGAAAIAAYGDQLSYKKRLALSALTGTVSPMFLLGTVRSWTSDPALCSKLLFCHWAGAVICAAVTYILCKNRAQAQPARFCGVTSNRGDDPLTQSIDAIFQVGGCIIRYSVLAEIIKMLLYPFRAVHPLIHAAMEISGGMYAIISGGFPSRDRNILLAAACGFTGFSILAQNHSFLKDIGVGFMHLFFLAIMRMILSSALMTLLA